MGRLGCNVVGVFHTGLSSLLVSLCGVNICVRFVCAGVVRVRLVFFARPCASSRAMSYVIVK